MLNRNPKDAEAEDLFQVENLALKLARDQNLSKVFLERNTKEQIRLISSVVGMEETLAFSSKLRSDQYHYDIAWSRVIHGTTVIKSLNRLLGIIEKTRS
jgi:hypothetical protein